jgi:hypothetical protein
MQDVLSALAQIDGMPKMAVGRALPAIHAESPYPVRRFG